jgi:hypothetical protein
MYVMVILTMVWTPGIDDKSIPPMPDKVRSKLGGLKNEN